MNTQRLTELVYKFQNHGIEEMQNGTVLIGKAPFIAPQAWLNERYPVLGPKEIDEMKNELDTQIPPVYRNFLAEYSNGLCILTATFCLYGHRLMLGSSIEASRQPFSITTPNKSERPDNAKNSYFFIGGYNWDGSHLYIDKADNTVHCCERWDATSKKQWGTLEEMILSEIERLYTLIDEEGRFLDEDKPTIPY